MKRKYIGADIYRSVALIFVMVYHCWVLMGYPAINNSILLMFVKLGGEIGVTLFFVLSGFGIYFSIEANIFRNDKFNWKEYARARIKRICPNYWISILLILSFTGSATYISINGIKDILTHLLFVHNLFVSNHGSINGVLWTMGVIVQFYFLSPIIYKLIKRHPFVSVVSSIGVSVVSKMLLFH